MPLPEHGTYSRRKNLRCGCDPCLKAGRDYANRRARLIAYGQWQPYTDAAPVREHIRALQAAGLSYRRIAAAAGTPESSVNRLLFCKPTVRRVRVHLAEKILAVHASPGAVSDGVPVDATGTRRRLQALAAVGWSGAKLAAFLGLDPTGVTRMFTAERVLARRARAVAKLYDRLWDQAPPEDSKQGMAAATRARREAAANGWAPPMAWDRIDDPASQPYLLHDRDWDEALVDPIAVERALNGEPCALNRAEAVEATRIGTERGLSAKRIATLIGRDSRSVIRYRTEVAA